MTEKQINELLITLQEARDQLLLGTLLDRSGRMMQVVEECDIVLAKYKPKKKQKSQLT